MPLADPPQGRAPWPAIGGWHLREIPSGAWLSARSGDVPGPVLALASEPQRITVVVDAADPGADTDQALSQMFAWLSSAGLTSIRLVMPAGAARYGPAASRAYGFDIVAAEGPVLVSPHGFALTRVDDADRPAAPRQWRQFRPAGDVVPAGMLSPSPRWEQELAAGFPDRVTGPVAVHRVQAGLALLAPGASAARLAAAHAVWPDPLRMTVVADGTGQQEGLALDAVMALLEQLPEAVTRSVRLWWPRAGADPRSPALHGMASRCAGEVIAPAADVSIAEGCCGLCHGPLGAAPWVRFTGDPPGQPMGPLYPVPAWDRALAAADLTRLAAGVIAERVPAGLCVYRASGTGPGRSGQGLAATARRILPDPVRVSVIADGTATSAEDRRALETVLGRLLPEAMLSLRIVLSDAAEGGEDSYAQYLADSLGGPVIAPTGMWTATPDGRLRAMGMDPAGGADTWREFLPRQLGGGYHGYQSAQRADDALGAVTAQLPAAPPPTTQSAAPPSTQSAAPPSTRRAAPPPSTTQPTDVDPPYRTPDPSGTAWPAARASPPGPAGGPAAAPMAFRGRMIPPTSDGRSTAEQRQLYRESSPQFHTHAVGVRRVLSQRPGLRAAAGDNAEALTVDFAALLDLLAGHPSAPSSPQLSDAAQQARLACANSGLRRLPSVRGPVFSPARLPVADVAVYVTGAILMEPSLVSATSSPSVTFGSDGEYVIWSETGKRIAALAASAPPDEVMFTAGTTFRILRVDAAPAAPRVFLRELAGAPRLANGAGPLSPPAKANPADALDRKVLDQLVTAAHVRDGAAGGQRAAAEWSRPAVPIGLDNSGVPFHPDGSFPSPPSDQRGSH
jgi:hypothetical protein